MAQLIAIGINHKTAPIEIREKFFLTSGEQDTLLSELKCNPAVLEGFVLSTCNRTEVYANVLSHQNYTEEIVKLISRIKKIPFQRDYLNNFYYLANKEVVQHLLQVTAGLDSLVLGERQVLGQVRDAVKQASERSMFGKTFNILANIAIRTGKKAHSETQISFGGSSVSWAAIEMAEKLLGSLQNSSILLIGAGKMGELTIDQVANKGFRNLYLMNRTEAKAQELAEKYNGVPVAFCDIKEVLSQVDVVICSAGAPHYILEKSTIEKVMKIRDGRKIVLIDISMPRNIDPQVSAVSDVVLYHLDDLKDVVEENLRKRETAAEAVKKIIDTKIADFYVKLAKLTDFPEHIPTSAISNS